MKRMRNCVLIFIILILSQTVHAQFVTVDSFIVTPTGPDSGDFSYTITNTVPLSLDIRVACEPPSGGEVYINVETLAASASFSDSFSIVSGLNDGDVYTLRLKDYNTGVEITTATVTFSAPVSTTTSTSTTTSILTNFVSVDSFTVTPTDFDAGEFSYTITNLAPASLEVRVSSEPPSGGEVYIRVETLASGA